MSTPHNIVRYVVFLTVLCICRVQAMLDEPVVSKEVVPYPVLHTTSFPAERRVIVGADDAINVAHGIETTSLASVPTAIEEASGAASGSNMLQPTQQVAPSEKTPTQGGESFPSMYKGVMTRFRE